jgi:hypothetical protein
MVCVLVLAAAAQDPTAFRDEVEEMGAFAARGGAGEDDLSVLLSTRLVFFQPVPAETAALPHDGDALVGAFEADPADNGYGGYGFAQ